MTDSAFNRRTLLLAVVAMSVLTLTTTRYAVAGAPVPRPWYLFIGVGAALGVALLAVVLVPSPEPVDTLVLGSVAILSSVVLRFSAFLTVVTSGVDHSRWVRRVQANVAAGGATGSDMYASAPLYLFELGVFQRVLGLTPFQTRFVTLSIAILLPAVVALFAYRIAGNTRTGLAALIVATPHFLFLRTSALLEAESMALLWFVLGLFFILRYLQTEDRRLLWLFALVFLSIILLHFLYAIVLLGTVAGTLALLALTERFSPLSTDLRGDRIRSLGSITVVAGVLFPVWILGSAFRGAALSLLKSLFRPGNADSGQDPTPTSTETSETTTPTSTETPEKPASTSTSSANDPPGSGRDGSPLSDGPGVSLLDMVADLIIPQSGTVARSVGAAGASADELLGALVPLLLVTASGGIGGLLAILRRRAEDLFLLATMATVTVAAITGVVLGTGFNIGYRLYYFIGLMLVVATSLAVSRASVSGYRVALSVIVLVGFLPYATVGPVSPLGNNVDPKIGGNDWRFTGGEYEQLRSLDAELDDGDEVQSAVPQVPGDIRIRTDGGSAVLRRGDCQTMPDMIADSGRFILCSQRNGQ